MGDRVPVTPGAETDVFAADIGADPGTQFGEKIGLRAAVAQDAVDPEPGDMVEATVTAADMDYAKRRVILACKCEVGDVVVLKGEATVLAPSAKFD